ncbi:hypothetical protein GJ744_005892 [Endocarpon pusillum]|uniref:Uncharacterized protein n=1 Tax=Endocarpon pusillum TaxID=364733 RepID=A0A8H7E659_9EURO|nr:hypothetical protein GJ744_005892 [Endocarpon pusillum]
MGEDEAWQAAGQRQAEAEVAECGSRPKPKPSAPSIPDLIPTNQAGPLGALNRTTRY